MREKIADQVVRDVANADVLFRIPSGRMNTKLVRNASQTSGVVGAYNVDPDTSMTGVVESPRS